MKKLLYTAITVIAALVFVACSISVEPETTESTAPVNPMVPAVPNTTLPQVIAPQQESFSPIVLVENEEICVKITGTEHDPIWGYTLKVYMENKTDKELLFTVNNVSINRFMCDPFWAESVAPGMRRNSSIYWFDSTLEENGISAVEEINLTLRVYDSKDFSAEDVYQGSFTIKL